MTGRTDENSELSSKERERIERREKKRRSGMVVSGRSVKTLAQIIQEKARGERPLTSGKKKKRRKKK